MDFKVHFEELDRHTLNLFDRLTGFQNGAFWDFDDKGRKAMIDTFSQLKGGKSYASKAICFLSQPATAGGLPALALYQEMGVTPAIAYEHDTGLMLGCIGASMLDKMADHLRAEMIAARGMYQDNQKQLLEYPVQLTLAYYSQVIDKHRKALDISSLDQP